MCCVVKNAFSLDDLANLLEDAYIGKRPFAEYWANIEQHSKNVWHNFTNLNKKDKASAKKDVQLHENSCFNLNYLVLERHAPYVRYIVENKKRFNFDEKLKQNITQKNQGKSSF